MMKNDINTFTFKPRVRSIKELIREVLKVEGCLLDILKELHGDHGSRMFNQAAAIREFMKYEEINGAVITDRVEAGELTIRQVWLHLAAVLKTLEKQGRLPALNAQQPQAATT